MSPTTRSLLSRSRHGFRLENHGQTTIRCLKFAFFAILAISLIAFLRPRSSHIASSNSTSISNSTFESSFDLPDENSENSLILASPDYSTDQSTDQSQPLDEEGCDVKAPINCADPEVYQLMMRATIEAFPNVHFHRFGKPVSGDETGMRCDMAWRYRTDDAKNPGTSKDYRRFEISRLETCLYSVKKIGDYHTGFNARKKKANKKVNNDKNKLDSFDDKFDSESMFRSGKYLVYVGGGDRCKNMNHYLWSLFCSLGEARFLNRTLVMDLSVCLSSVYSSWNRHEEGKDFRYYFDFEHLRDSASVIDSRQFWLNWKLWQNKDKLRVHVLDDSRVTPMKLRIAKETLIIRKFGIVEPDNYWYQVCEGEARSHIKRPWNLLKKSPRLIDIVSGINSRLNGDFDSVRILPDKQEGETNSKLNLHALLEKLEEKIEHGRDLYIATDESEPDFSIFGPLRDNYKIHFLNDFKELWAEKTEWFVETKKLNNGITIEFDGYMRREVNMEIFLLGKNQIKWDQNVK